MFDFSSGRETRWAWYSLVALEASAARALKATIAMPICHPGHSCHRCLLDCLARHLRMTSWAPWHPPPILVALVRAAVHRAWCGLRLLPPHWSKFATTPLCVVQVARRRLRPNVDPAARQSSMARCLGTNFGIRPRPTPSRPSTCPPYPRPRPSPRRMRATLPSTLHLLPTRLARKRLDNAFRSLGLVGAQTNSQITTPDCRARSAGTSRPSTVPYVHRFSNKLKFLVGCLWDL